MASSKKPKVFIPCNVVNYDGLAIHSVRDTYIRALVEVADCLPLLIPAIGKNFNYADIASDVDGILLTGSPSHVAPACYGAKQEFGDEELDLARDATAFPVIKEALALDKPIIAICRGFQELNITLGGTLHQFVHDQPGKRDHRGKNGLTLPEKFQYQSHKVTAQKGGWFEKLGLPSEFTVNSLHQQAVDKLGTGLHVEAISEDGLIEAVSVPNKKFALGTQWHPEGDFMLNPTSVKILKAFGDALRG